MANRSYDQYCPIAVALDALGDRWTLLILRELTIGERRFTGRLSMTWPRTEDQVPINVGDDDYDPLFPYGWGLRT